MRKYYTRACNFYYGKRAKEIIKKKIGLPLCGLSTTAFTEIEILSRDKKFKSKVISIKEIKNLRADIKKITQRDIKKITSKRKKIGKSFNLNHPLIMGILNLTPDSFSDGGLYNNKTKSFLHIQKMIKSGADIIDIGGESTRPGSKNVSYPDEWKRIKIVVEKFKKKYSKVLLSVDTRKSDIMLNSIKNKADVINDVSGFNHDVDAITKIKKYKIYKVIHHMQGTPNTMQINPKYKNVLLDIYDFFEKKLNKDFKKFKDKKFILDPGIGFGKNLKHNLILMNKISLFHSLGFPLLIGTSRKRFISQISKKFDNKERLGGTMASILFTLSQGVQIFRVHNVEEVKQGVLVYKKLLDQ
ncbi:MAG: dihydropteroate synthase [Pelagibacterales bacterium]|jgi:dihydropteroate synthase|nr:dihydropteroate synthase [Pelagibacterales bacterium]